MERERFLLIRFSGDLSVKSRGTRERFTRRLGANLKDALRRAAVPHRLHRQWSRFLVETEHEGGAEIVARVFGVQSLSPTVRRPWSALSEVVASGEELFRGAVAGRRFAVRAGRVGETARIPFRSTDVERGLGRALLGHAAAVDLDHPEVTASVEVHAGFAYFFTRRIAGPGGLPLGVEGRALALVSGGFDSAVAAWMSLKRGVGLDYVFFNLGGPVHERGAVRVAKALVERWSHGDRPRWIEIDFRPVIEEIQAAVAPRYWQVVLKRSMLRAATRLAETMDLPALVTGEALGQVSSQTLANLAVISRATELPILRPLTGFNKDEIVDLARRIGTYALSCEVREYCDLLVRRPATRASLETVEEEERKLDPCRLEEAVAGRLSLDLRRFQPDTPAAREVDAGDLPPAAVVLDLRSAGEYGAWHLPDALCLEYGQALRSYRSFDRARPYALYCQVGLKSLHLAELMREAGFEAFTIRGDLRDLRRRFPLRPPAAPPASPSSPARASD